VSGPPARAADLQNQSGVGDERDTRPQRGFESRSTLVGLAVFLFAVALFLPLLGGREIDSRAEARIPLVALDIVRTGRILPPYLLDVPYLNKPPLHHLLVAAAIKIFGRHDEWVVRLPSVLCGAAAIWLTWLLMTRLAGIHAGVVAGAFLFLFYRFFSLARSTELEILLTAATALSYLGLARVLWASPGPPDRSASSSGWWIAAAGAVIASLTKGPLLALLFPFVLLVADAILKRSIRRLLSLGPLIILLGAAVGTAMYYGPLAVELGGVSALWKRLTLGNVLHAHGFHYYLWQLPLGLLPAGLALPWMVIALRRPDPVARTCALAVAIGVLVFSLSPSKQSHYLLPLYPLVAIWAAAALAERSSKTVLIFACVGFGLGVALVELAVQRSKSDGTVRETLTDYGVRTRGRPLGLVGRHPVVAYYLDREDLEFPETPAAAVEIIEGGGAVVADVEKGESLPAELVPFLAAGWPKYSSPALAHSYILLHKPR
jgi:4-amino-4-deoxy-L-arabinose transferase-like glycosyltransferase